MSFNLFLQLEIRKKGKKNNEMMGKYKYLKMLINKRSIRKV